MNDKRKKRFIAGATCPQCKDQDSLMLFFENNVEQMRCVSCGYQEAQTTKAVSQQTRSAEQVIGIFKPGS